MYHVLEGKPLNASGGINFSGNSGYSGEFFEGSRVTSGKILVNLECEKTDLPDYFELFCTPVVGSEFIDLLSAVCPDRFQSVPAEVRFENSTVCGYHVLNVLKKIPALDMENTVGNKFKNKFIRMKHMKIDDRISDMSFPMFRLAEFPTIIIINDDIRMRIESRGFSGTIIMDADGWSDSHRF